MVFKQRNAFSYPPVGRCIYCGSTVSLTREHIVPFSLGGTAVLPKSSCKRCAEITRDFEQSCARTLLGNMRMQLGFPTRNKKKRPEYVNLEITTRKKRAESRAIKFQDLPMLPILLPVLDPPGILSNLQPSDDVKCTLNFYSMGDQDAAREKYRNLVQPDELTRIAIPVKFPYLAFARLLGKIAYAQAVAEYGLEAFRPLLLPYILGQDTRAPYVIGGTTTQVKTSPKNAKMHWLIEFGIFNRGDKRFFTARIELFRFLKQHPSYWVAVAEADDRLSHLILGS